jgi:hypothetical protein
MDKIIFDIDLSLYPNINNFTSNELGVISKQLFHEWYMKKYSNMGSDISSQLENSNNKIRLDIDEKISSLKLDINNLNNVTRDVFGLSKTSQKRGEIIENKIYELFENNYQNYSYKKTNHLPHSGDAILASPSLEKYLIEIKNYQTSVDQKEINKLKYDMEYTNIQYGLFLSIQSGIVGKKSIDIEKFIKDGKEFYIVFISYVFDEVHKIDSGICILETLTKYKKINKNILFDNKLSDVIKEISCISDVVTSLRKEYQIMERKMKDNIDDFYIIIRENELQIKHKINELCKEIINEDIIEYEDFDIVKNKYIKTNCYLILNRLIDILETYKYKLSVKDDNIYYISKNENIAELKLFVKKIDIICYNPKLTLSFINKEVTDIDYKFFEGILLQYNF